MMENGRRPKTKGPLAWISLLALILFRTSQTTTSASIVPIVLVVAVPFHIVSGYLQLRAGVDSACHLIAHLAGAVDEDAGDERPRGERRSRRTRNESPDEGGG